MKKFTEMITEQKANTKGYIYEYGCVMMSFEIENWKEILSEINTEDIYDEDGFGLEDQSHITLLWGILQGVETEDIRKALEFTPQPYVELRNINIFQNEKFDVVKFDVECDILNQINNHLSTAFPNDNTHPEYHPHMTISYIKPGRGSTYIKTIDKPIIIKPIEIIYGVPTGTTKKEVVVLKKW